MSSTGVVDKAAGCARKAGPAWASVCELSDEELESLLYGRGAPGPRGRSAAA